jgi:hypothetical protein
MPDTVLNLDWKPLSEAVQKASNTPGVYFLGAPFRIVYGSTSSRVFYIGSSSNLRKRLVSHLSNSVRGNFLLLQLASPTRDNIACCSFAFAEAKGGRLLVLEGRIMYAFGLKHGFIPHGNRIPESSSDDTGSARIEIVESVSTALELLNEDQIAARYNMRVDRHPYSMYNSLSVDLEIVGKDVKIVEKRESPKIYSINFMIAPKMRPGRL